MNKYMIVAFLPLLFQSAVYGADLNAIIKTELEQARKISHYSGPLKFDPVLETLVSFSQKGKVEKAAAIVRIKSIKAALEKYKSEQYPTYWSKWFGSTPEIVKNQINPALAKVENALKLLNATSMSTGYIVGGTVFGVAAAAALATAAIWYFTPVKKSDAVDSGRRDSNASDDSYVSDASSVSLESPTNRNGADAFLLHRAQAVGDAKVSSSKRPELPQRSDYMEGLSSAQVEEAAVPTATAVQGVAITSATKLTDYLPELMRFRREFSRAINSASEEDGLVSIVNLIGLHETNLSFQALYDKVDKLDEIFAKISRPGFKIISSERSKSSDQLVAEAFLKSISASSGYPIPLTDANKETINMEMHALFFDLQNYIKDRYKDRNWGLPPSQTLTMTQEFIYRS